MDVTPGFKQSDAGAIPDDWELHSIGNSMRLINGRAFKPSDWRERGLPIIRIQNLNNRDASFNYYEGPVDERHHLHPGDLVFAWSGTTGTSFGARIWDGPEGVLNQHIFKVLPNTQKLTRRYAFHVLLKTQAAIERHAHGFKSSFVHVKKSDLVTVLLPLPPKIEQEAIAEALSDADALIESLEQLIAKKRLIKQGVMRELLTGKRRLPGFESKPGPKPSDVGQIPGDWDVDVIKNHMHITTGGRNTQDRIADGRFPFFVRSQTVERINSFSYEGEAVLTAGDGVGTGKIFHYINGRFDVHQRVYRMTEFSERLDGYFFYLYFSSRFYERVMQMTAKSSVDSVRMEMIADMYLILPSIEEQRAIAAVLSDMEAEVEALGAKLAKTRQIKQGMMHNLLTGKIRLV